MSMPEIKDEQWVIDHFNGFLAAGSAADRKDFLLKHPVLLSFKALKIVNDLNIKDDLSKAALAYLDETRVHFWQHPDEYPFGLGPIERVVSMLRNGSIGFDDALKEACNIDCSGQLSHTYLRALMLDWVSEVEIDVTFAMKSAEIALESAWAMPFPQLALDVRRSAAEGFIRLVHGGLMRRPDGRLYKRAIEIGEWALEDAEQSGKIGLKGEYLHELGTLVLDAYTAKFGPSLEFKTKVIIWLTKAIDPMPTPAVALKQAENYLSESVDLREPGSPRGKTLKALLEAVIYGDLASSRNPDPEQIKKLAKKALTDLEQQFDGAHIQRVQDLAEAFT